MRIDLTPRCARYPLFPILLLVAGFLPFLGGKAWLAAYDSASANPKKWEQAAALEPSDAQSWTNLGLYEQSGLTHGGLRTGIGYFRRAVSADPGSAQRWLDLAAAYRDSGDAADARSAFRRAEENSPLSAEVAWRYGNFLRAENESAAADRELHRALAIQPSLAASAISECWQQKPDVAPILNDVLPPLASVYLAALNFFLDRNLLGPALAVWNRLLELHLPVKMSEAIPLLNVLIGVDDRIAAKQTWSQALRAAHWPRDRTAGGSLVFNGGFEHPIAGGGFDWREVRVAGATFSVDRQVRHSGSQSLRIDFDGTANLDFQNVFEVVAVRPRARYRFSAYVRTLGITTDSGVRFRIFDPVHPAQVQILTPSMVGTRPWSPMTLDLETGRDTDLLEIALRRVPTWKFDDKIRGTVWIDDVSLVLIQPKSQEGRK